MLAERGKSTVTDVARVSRRQFIALGSASAAWAAVSRRSLVMIKSKEVSMSELVRLSAVGALAKLQKGDVTAEQYAAMCLFFGEFTALLHCNSGSGNTGRFPSHTLRPHSVFFSLDFGRLIGSLWVGTVRKCPLGVVCLNDVTGTAVVF
jgi:hypothetical protein